MEEIKKIIVGSEELTDILGYKNRNYISELVNDFGMPKEGYNEFDLYKVIKWHKEYLENIHRAEIERIKAEKPQDDLARKNATLKQMEIDKEQGNTLTKEAHMELIYTLFTVFANGIDTIGPNAATELIDKHDTKEIITIIKKRSDKVKSDIAAIGKIIQK